MFRGPSLALREGVATPGSRSGGDGGGLLGRGADRGFSEGFGGGGDPGAFEEVGVLHVQEAHGVAKADQPCGGQ